MQGQFAQEMLRILYCSSACRFIEIWGDEDGPILWDLLIHRYSKNRGRLLVEMTSNQAEKLAAYTRKTLPPQIDPSQLGNILDLGDDDEKEKVS